MESKKSKSFKFKKFQIFQDDCVVKISTDGVLLGGWTEAENAKSILDIGTGTGVIAIMLAQRNPIAIIDSVEIEKDAYEQAKINIKISPWKNRVNVICSSVQDFQKTTNKKYDLIVSNPPFFENVTVPKDKKKAAIRHTIKLPQQDLLASAKNLLTDSGIFSLILPYVEGMRFIKSAANYNLFPSKITEVFTKKNKPVERLLMQFEKTKRKIDEDKIIIRDDIDEFSIKYRELLKDFYLYF